MTSARGLFKATGKTAHVELERESDDFYPTPREPIDRFLNAEFGPRADRGVQLTEKGYPR